MNLGPPHLAGDRGSAPSSGWQKDVTVPKGDAANNSLGRQVCPRAVEAGVASGYDRAWMVLTDLNAYVSVCPRHPCV